MSDIKLAYQSAQAMTVTNLHSLASSATAGWQSAVVDNTSNLYIDYIAQVVLDFANTAPANDKSVYVYVYGALETAYTNPASGSEGAITVTNVTSTRLNLKLAQVIPYETQDEIAEGQPFSVKQAFGGIMAPKWGLVLVNYSGAALHSSGNTVKYSGVYMTSS